ncbi:hypothetical protein DVH24_018299 [Malus domestica]|uniref:Uncharacterized protein n=1 Tax=Malus domestica TaxID=3750 RepID=A0A498KFU1_MALDO|nr:hypothetical protein DVH24_018299 [Malus domestica]
MSAEPEGATHVWPGLVNLVEQQRQWLGDICQVIFYFCESVCIKSCGVHLLASHIISLMMNTMSNNIGFPYLRSQRIIIQNTGRLISMFLLVLRRRRRRSKSNRPFQMIHNF